MLLGEHAVLRGKHAIACAIKPSIYVELTPRTDRTITIQSGLGEFECNLEQIVIKKPFEFILTAIRCIIDRITHGFDLRIDSEIPTNLGLGSSAAVTVAICDCLHQYLGQPIHQQELLNQARHIIRRVQGVGSGCDAAASIWQCPVFCMPDGDVCTLPKLPELTVLYSGYKTPTSQVIAKVNADNPPNCLFDQIDETVLAGREAIVAQDWVGLGQIFDQAHELLCSLQVSTPLLDEVAESLRDTPGIYGAKISGSGLGDCVIGLGSGTVKLSKRLVEKGVREIL